VPQGQLWGSLLPEGRRQAVCCATIHSATLICSSCKVADRRPSKRLKCGKKSLVKSELEGLTCGSENRAALGETPKTSEGDRCSEDPGDCNIIQQKKAESISETNEDKQEEERSISLKARAVKSSSSVLSGGSSLEDADLLMKTIQLDSSAFLDEDSNQPMPADRFFGDVEFIQDLPPVALPSTMMSRRQFRKLHFIAKEDEEEEEDVV
uniref:Chromosome 1 open reading frame 174 n=1 Tax=Bubo bubo TaxID=30461 RepID=A0A8C0E7S5_BUBBB